MQEYFESLRKRSDMPVEKEQAFRTTLLTWLDKQVEFAEDLCDRYIPRVLALLPEQSRDTICGLFTNWWDAIEQSKARRMHAGRQGLWPLAQSIGFHLPPA